MKRIILLVMSVFVVVPLVFSADIPLKATWDPNTEPDVKEYRIYRVDGIRTLVGTVQHPTVVMSFVLSVSDGIEGQAKYVATAVDSMGNESADSNTVTIPFDRKPPVAPEAFKISSP